MEKIAFSVGFKGNPEEYPELPVAGDLVSLVRYDIENLARCCSHLLNEVGRLRAEIDALKGQS